MPASKTEQFSQETNEIVAFLKSMANATRYTVLQETAKGKILTHREICKMVNLTKSTVGEHLNKLKNQKLIKERYTKSGYEISFNRIQFKMIIEKVLSSNQNQEIVDMIKNISSQFDASIMQINHDNIVPSKTA